MTILKNLKPETLTLGDLERPRNLDALGRREDDRTGRHHPSAPSASGAIVTHR
jgi:hypothetical protein